MGIKLVVVTLDLCINKHPVTGSLTPYIHPLPPTFDITLSQSHMRFPPLLTSLLASSKTTSSHCL